jgi:hypothetical protein
VAEEQAAAEAARVEAERVAAEEEAAAAAAAAAEAVRVAEEQAAAEAARVEAERVAAEEEAAAAAEAVRVAAEQAAAEAARVEAERVAAEQAATVEAERVAAEEAAAQSVSVVSWNAKLLNISDQKDENMVDAAMEKGRKIGERAMKGDVCADLVCIQEAPGPQLLTTSADSSWWSSCMGSYRHGMGARQAVEEDLLASALAESMNMCAAELEGPRRRYETTNVVVNCYRNGVDVGETHVFCYDETALKLVVQGRLLEPCKEDMDEGRSFHRAPAMCHFDVLKDGSSLKGAQLIVVSVHLKSGGGDETVAEVKRTARALSEYMQAHLKAGDTMDGDTGKLSIGQSETAQQPKQRTVLLVLGDFNLDTADVKRNMSDAGFAMTPCFNDGPTNMWQFTKTGLEKDGKQYDSALCWEGEGQGQEQGQGQVVCTGGLLAVAEISRAYDEMVRVAAALATQPATTGVSIRALGGVKFPTRGAAAKAIARGDSEAPRREAREDGVPVWLKERYRDVVNSVWSDHMPIVVQLHTDECTS